MGLSSVSLGHAHKHVIDAVKKEIDLGVNFQRPSYIEHEMAKVFLSLIPKHGMIKFTKNGSTATSAAVKLSRAKTGRKLIAFPSDHPFFSYDDWFICTTPCDFGIPKEIAALTVTYDSMNPQSLRDLIAKYPDQIAGLITEPDSIADACKYSKEEVAKAHLEIGQICKENGIVFIVDEMVSGYRSGFPGATTVYGYDADICCWGKSIGNGYSFCAMTGKAAIMDIGGIKKHFDKDGKEYPRLFLCSTTHGAEAHGLAAALAVIQTYRDNDVIGHQHRMVARLDAGIRQAVKDAGMEKNIQVMKDY